MSPVAAWYDGNKAISASTKSVVHNPANARSKFVSVAGKTDIDEQETGAQTWSERPYTARGGCRATPWVRSVPRCAQPSRTGLFQFLGDPMLPFHVTRLMDVAAVAGDWVPVSASAGPRGEICLLLADRPNAQDWSRLWEGGPDPLERPRYGERFRIVQNDGREESALLSVDLPIAETPARSVASLGDERWLVCHWLDDGRTPSVPEYDVLGRVVDPTRKVLGEFVVGSPWMAQATPGGAIWLGYPGHDERVFGGMTWLEDADVRRLDRDGTVRFSFNRDVAGRGAAPHAYFVDALNVVSDHEVWIACEGIDRNSEEFYSYHLVRLLDDLVAGLWPSSVIGDKAPVRLSRAFAVAEGNLLLQGDTVADFRLERASPDRDQDRLYLVSLNSARSVELLPVDEDGNWIGEFWVFESRGPLLYLKTKRFMYCADIRHAIG